LNVFVCIACLAQQHPAPAHPRIVTIVADSDDVAVLRLRPGYVASVFLPEEVNAIVVGDPGSFRAEHSESEPRLVTVKPTTPKAAETNLLVTTRSGRKVSLHLVSDGRSNNSGDVDFVLQYEESTSALIPVSRPSLFIPDTKEVDSPAASNGSSGVIGPAERELILQSSLPAPNFVGKTIRVSVGRLTDTGDAMIVGFSVLNASSESIELLPPQIELAGPQRKQHNRSIKAGQSRIPSSAIRCKLICEVAPNSRCCKSCRNPLLMASATINDATPAATPTTEIPVMIPMNAWRRLARRYRDAMKNSKRMASDQPLRHRLRVG